MRNKLQILWVGLTLSLSGLLQAQPVQKWQDRNGEWHFGDPRAAPQHSRDVRIQQPISVVKNQHPLPRYTPNSNQPSSAPRNRSNSRAALPQKRSKSDCESLRESLTLQPARQQQHRQRQQQYERECVMGVYYADSQQ